MSERQPITYADAQPDLPKSDFAKRLAELRLARTFAEQSSANDNAQRQRRGQDQQQSGLNPHERQERSMVEEERPFPHPRPSPDFANDADAALFEARWEAQRRRSEQRLEPQQGERPMSDDQPPRRPVETLREGQLKAAIWQNESDNGKYHSVTVARTYKNQDGQLQDTSSFRAKDMLGLSELARRAHHHAHDLDREAFKEQRREQQEQGQERSQSHSR